MLKRPLAILALSSCVAASFAFAACDSETESQPPGDECESNADCSGDTPFCGEDAACEAMPAGSAIGVGDGSPESVDILLVLSPDKGRVSTDLAWNPAVKNQLWVLNSQDDSVIVAENAGTEDVTWKRLHDPAAAHFMDKSPALAFGEVVPTYGQTFAVCGDSDNGGNKFMGPALFTADLSIFAEPTPNGLGSHLDMLHSTSYCRGIEHIEKSIYFAFNSDKGSLDKYDFHADHGPGNDDHSDGEIWRYADGEVAGVDGVPSHLAYDEESKLLYVADTGHKRIVVLDTESGEMGSSFAGDEPVDRTMVEGATLTELFKGAPLEAPSGIELHDGILYVSDNATSQIHAFDLTGKLVNSLDTGFKKGSLAGMAFGLEDEKLYFVDMLTSRVYRIEPKL